jgi:hypothetical protein
MAYRANVTDKQQVDIERAADDSAIRVMWFDWTTHQVGAVKSFRALDAQPQGNAAQPVTDACKMVRNSIAGGIGSHNDRPSCFFTPGKV